MTRDKISMTLTDVSGFARALKREAGDDAGHQTWLNRISRAAGFRNFQHLSATRKGAEVPADDKVVTKALRYFDSDGRMAVWPAKTRLQLLCLWVIWAELPRGEVLNERQISARIDTLTEFADAAIVRRTMVACAMMVRERDGSAYQRVERRPPPEALALIRALGEKNRP